MRKAIGGAYGVMSRKEMRGDVYSAWPSAAVAVMGARGALGVLIGGAAEGGGGGITPTLKPRRPTQRRMRTPWRRCVAGSWTRLSRRGRPGGCCWPSGGVSLPRTASATSGGGFARKTAASLCEGAVVGVVYRACNSLLALGLYEGGRRRGVRRW